MKGLRDIFPLESNEISFLKSLLHFHFSLHVSFLKEQICTCSSSDDRLQLSECGIMAIFVGLKFYTYTYIYKNNCSSGNLQLLYQPLLASRDDCNNTALS